MGVPDFVEEGVHGDEVRRLGGSEVGRLGSSEVPSGLHSLITLQAKRPQNLITSNLILLLKLIDTVHIGLGTRNNNIGVGAKAVVYVAVIFHLHVHLTNVV